jgi:hypothetical protein
MPSLDSTVLGHIGGGTVPLLLLALSAVTPSG